MQRSIRRDITRFEHAKEEMSSLNLGGTAIGTGLNADVQYLPESSEEYRSGIRPGSGAVLDLIDATQNLDGYTWRYPAL